MKKANHAITAANSKIMNSVEKFSLFAAAADNELNPGFASVDVSPNIHLRNIGASEQSAVKANRPGIKKSKRK